MSSCWTSAANVQVPFLETSPVQKCGEEVRFRGYSHSEELGCEVGERVASLMLFLGWKISL